MQRTGKKLICSLLVALGATAAQAAPRLGPPSDFMVQERHRSAVVEVLEALGDSRFRLRIVERLHGDSPDVLVVRAAQGVSLEASRTYVVGYTDKPARRSPRWQTDPEGPRVLNVPAVGPAVFENTAAMRILVRAAADPGLTDRAHLGAVLKQISRTDVPSQRFAAAELMLDAELRELAGEAEVGVLRSLLEAERVEAMAHDHLLRAAAPMVERWGGDWLAADCRRVISSHGPDLDLTSAIPALLKTALEVLGRIGVPADAARVRPHVGSNNPGVGKAAFEAMAALDPALATQVASRVLQDPELHPDTRRFIQRLSQQMAADPGGR